MKHQELVPVTIGVATYNSSKYVVETLDSIKAQTYPKLKLIVSDDCSTDQTIEIVKEWVVKNSARFIGVKILTVPHNTGVSANFNRMWDACDTEWEKDIAGDDILFSTCIEDNMRYVAEFPSSIVIFSRVRPFKVVFGKKVFGKESKHDYSFFKLSPEEQKKYLLYQGNNLPAAPCFYNISRLRELNIRHDERIPLLEDYPKWIMFSRKGVRFDFLDKHTVGYRMNEKSLSVGLYSPSFYKSNLLLYLYYYQDGIKDESEREEIYNLMCDEALRFYTTTYKAAINARASLDFKIGHMLLLPFRVCKLALRVIYNIITKSNICLFEMMK